MPTTRAIRIHAFGGSDVLKLEELPLPEPKDDDIVLKVLAASINPVDYKTRNGSYPRITADQLPVTLGRDVSGVVELCGPRATEWKKGDAVYAFLTRPRGGYAEHVLVTAKEAAAKPARLSHVEAAAVPLAGMTAWQGLFDHGGLQSGERVLIHGGNGGGGHPAGQLAKAKSAWGATTASPMDVPFVLGLGADQVVDYRAQRFEDLVQPVDLVLDLIAGETQERSWALLKPGGRLVTALGQISEEKARAKGVRATSFFAQTNATQLAEIGQLIDAGKVRVEIQATFPLPEVARAQDRLEKEHNRGKVVLDFAH